MKANIIKNLLDGKVICDEDIEEYYHFYYANNVKTNQNISTKDESSAISYNPIEILIKLDYICEEDIKDDLIQYYENNIKNKIATL